MSARLQATWMACIIGLAVGCGGAKETGDSGDQGSTSAPVADQEQPVAADPQQASRGQELFTLKGCNACHTVGSGRLIGPDLSGVTDRRTRGWILGMITNPDSMIRQDSIAHRLFGEYMTPMANQNLTRDEAGAVYQYLLSTND